MLLKTDRLGPYPAICHWAINMKKLLITLVIIILLAAVGWAYWYFLMGPVQAPQTPAPQTKTPVSFTPINRPGSGKGNTTATSTSGGQGANRVPMSTPPAMGFSALRLISDAPVGGYTASTTASSTSVIWVDRGRGNVYRANLASTSVDTLSNTVVPKIFNAIWNKNATAFVGSLLEDSSLVPSSIYAELMKLSSTSKDQLAPYELRGKNLPGKVLAYATSPDKTKLAYISSENGNAVAYISSFNGQGAAKLFTVPMTQISVSWPSDSVIAISTKASLRYAGYLYFINPKSGIWTKILGPLTGLSSAVSADGKRVLYSYSDGGRITTKIFNVSAATSTDAVITTLAEKCAWSSSVKDAAYCAVPNEIGEGYPDSWYIGSSAGSDKVWQINATTGEVRLVSSVVNEADRSIDAYRLSLDPKDRFLFFMNKNDLSLWSLELSKTR